jgi:hypothetical protein
VDILFVHIYPYWDGVAVENGAKYILEKWNELKAKYPNKTMVIGETGWPSQGDTRRDAIPSEGNQKKYISDFIAMANSNKIDYFYFSIFDEKWKSRLEGTVGAHWGLFNSDGSPKPQLKDLIPEPARNGIPRPPGKVNPAMATFPLYIYSNACDPKNSFYSSGWMGELPERVKKDSTIKSPTDILDEASTDNPFSGKTCIRISYKPSPGQWGGIYWQFPVNNWGQYPGYDFSKSLGTNAIIKLKFRVRGKQGGEKAKFITGGIKDVSLPYFDSYSAISTDIRTLTSQWKLDSLVLTGRNLSMVIGGFCWVTDYNQNPQGATIYLDDIVFQVLAADFISTPVSGLTVQFTDVSTGVVTNRLWNFGDRQTSTEKNPSHTYTNKGVYTVSLTVTGPDGSSTKTRNFTVAVNERTGHEIPKVFALYPNYPNPFNPSTTIEYSLPTAAFVELKVYNVFGREVTTLVNGKQEAGPHRVLFDSQGLPGGVYFYRLQTEDGLETKKMVVVR